MTILLKNCELLVMIAFCFLFFCATDAITPNACCAFHCGFSSNPHQIRHLGKRHSPSKLSTSSNGIEDVLARARHTVGGIDCVEVTLDVDMVGPVTILEATAESQEDLVNMALEEEGQEQQLASGDPYGAVLWPAAFAIANHLVKNCGKGGSLPLEGLKILELGAGTGLVSIAAALGGARVVATDYEDIPLQLLEYAATNLNTNKKLDNSEQQLPINMPMLTAIETKHLDMCSCGDPLPEADIVVAADVMYEPKTGRAVAVRVVEALRRGNRVLVGDSPGRAGRPAFLEELERLGVSGATFVDEEGQTCSGPRHELICRKDSRSVSKTPQKLEVAVMDLDPSSCQIGQ